MAIDAPLLAGQPVAIDVVLEFHQRMAGQARAQNARHMLCSPADHLLQRPPKRLRFNRRLGDIGPGDNEGVQTRVAQVVEVGVIRVNIRLRLGAARQAGDGEGMHVKLHDLVATPHQAHILLFRHHQRRVGHHIEQPDVEFADVLSAGAF